MDNDLSGLPETVFDDLGALETLDLRGNDPGWTLPEPGRRVLRYLVRLTTYNGEPYVSPNVSEPPGVDFRFDERTEGRLSVGGSVTGNIYRIRDTDAFLVTLTPGTPYVIDLEGADTMQGTLGHPAVRVGYKQGGSYGFPWSDHGSGTGENARLVFTPDSARMYFAEVYSVRSGDTGTYRLSLDEKRDPPDAPPAPSPLPYDSSLIVSWTPPANDGNSPVTSYDLRHIPSGSPDADKEADANWTVIDPAWESGRLRHDTTGLANGTEYDVQVRAVNARGDGAWSETATGTPEELVDQMGNWCNRATTRTLEKYCTLNKTGRLAVGQAAIGEIGEEGNSLGARDADWFQLTLEAGKTYRIDALGDPSGDGTLADPYLRGMYAVYRGDEYQSRGRLNHNKDKVVSVWRQWAPPGEDVGERLFRSQYNDDGGLGKNARLYLRGFEEGEYFVAVLGVSSRGTYQLTMTEVEDDDPGMRSLALGVPANGELDFPEDEDVFEVQLSADTEYEVRLEPTGSGWDRQGVEWPRIAEVTGAANPTEVTCGGYSDQNSAVKRQSCVFTASEGGAHRITVGGSITSSRQDYSTGPYKLTVTAVTAR